MAITYMTNIKIHYNSKNIINKIPKSKIKFIPIQNKSVIVHVSFVLFIVCLYICVCVCECLLQNNNHKTKHENNTNCGSAFEPGASGLPYYCTSICVRFGCTRRANCVDSIPKKQKMPSISLCMCVRMPLSLGSIAGVSSSRVLPGYPITAHHL